MVVKSLIYGTATGIAVAAFSGKGEGYDGFTQYYLKNFAFAAGVNVAYWLGVRLLAYVPFGQALGLIWGFVILAVLVIRIRVMMQAALLEAAIEDAVRQDGGRVEARRRSSRRSAPSARTCCSPARSSASRAAPRCARPRTRPPGTMNDRACRRPAPTEVCA